jgi:hypothetical protein
MAGREPTPLAQAYGTQGHRHRRPPLARIVPATGASACRNFGTVNVTENGVDSDSGGPLMSGWGDIGRTCSELRCHPPDRRRAPAGPTPMGQSRGKRYCWRIRRAVRFVDSNFGPDPLRNYRAAQIARLRPPKRAWVRQPPSRRHFASSYPWACGPSPGMKMAGDSGSGSYFQESITTAGE